MFELWTCAVVLTVVIVVADLWPLTLPSDLLRKHWLVWIGLVQLDCVNLSSLFFFCLTGWLRWSWPEVLHHHHRLSGYDPLLWVEFWCVKDSMKSACWWPLVTSDLSPCLHTRIVDILVIFHLSLTPTASSHTLICPGDTIGGVSPLHLCPLPPHLFTSLQVRRKQKCGNQSKLPWSGYTFFYSYRHCLPMPMIWVSIYISWFNFNLWPLTHL